MSAKILSRLSYANVMATLAFFLAIGGGAYAALKLPKNSVGSAQIKADAVNSSKVKKRSLLANDFKLGQLPQGPQGIQGIQGIQGERGPTGFVGNVIVRRLDVPLAAGAPGAENSAFVKCADGEKIIGGAANVSASPQSELLVDRPATDNTGSGGYPADGQAFTFWKGTARNLNNTATTDLRVFAICAQVP
jgi:hypothetical protein